MAVATLKIRCGNCGREEEVVEYLGDGIIDFNLDKLCPACPGVWMTKKELRITKN
jgi:hypothetical protein